MLKTSQTLQDVISRILNVKINYSTIRTRLHKYGLFGKVVFNKEYGSMVCRVASESTTMSFVETGTKWR